MRSFLALILKVLWINSHPEIQTSNIFKLKTKLQLWEDCGILKTKIKEMKISTNRQHNYKIIFKQNN